MGEGEDLVKEVKKQFENADDIVARKNEENVFFLEERDQKFEFLVRKEKQNYLIKHLSNNNSFRTIYEFPADKEPNYENMKRAFESLCIISADIRDQTEISKLWGVFLRKVQNRCGLEDNRPIHDFVNDPQFRDYDLDPKPRTFEEFKGWVDVLIDPRLEKKYLEKDVEEWFNAWITPKFVDKETAGRVINYINKKSQKKLPKAKVRELINFEGKYNQEKIQLSVKEYTDLIAEELLNTFEIITLSDTREMLFKRNIAYIKDKIPLIKVLRAKLKTMPKGTYCSSKENVLENMRDGTLIDRDSLCYNPWIIPFQNGIYNVKKDKFYKSDRGLNFFYEIPHNFDPNSNYDCPKFKKALVKWLDKKIYRIDPDNPKKMEKTAYRKGERTVLLNDIFEIIGYCMSMNNKYKKAFLNHGETDSAKTTFTNIITEVIGEENISASSLQNLVDSNFGTNAIKDKILNINPDLPNTKIYNSGIFKALTGGDREIQVEKKNGPHYEIKPITKLMFNANKIPPVHDVNDDAFYNRWILILFPNKFNHKYQNVIRDFEKQIISDKSEIQGIIHESIEGFKRLIDRGGFREELVKNAEHTWKYKSDPLYAFIYDNCKRDPNGRIEKETFIEEYNEYRGKRDLSGVSKRSITIKLQKRNIKSKRLRENGERKYFYIGIKWKENIKLANNSGKIDVNSLF
jgi:P4 family phage/plasmid primase-like protien